MKKFSFPLDTVLKYKDEVLENLRNEHGKVLKLVSDQENLIESMKQSFYEYNQAYNEKKRQGITIVEAISYESYLHQLDLRIKAEYIKLDELKIQAEKKRLEVVEAKKETSSIEKLKEKKIEQYKKEVQKSEELMIEEFVSNMRVANN